MNMSAADVRLLRADVRGARRHGDRPGGRPDGAGVPDRVGHDPAEGPSRGCANLGLEIDVERLLGVYKILLDVQRCVLDILGCSEVFYTLFASRLFSRPCATP